MRKIKLEKITGIVALSYLVLIPAGAFYVWKRVEAIDKDLTEMWQKLDMPPTEAKPVIDVSKILGGMRR